MKTIFRLSIVILLFSQFIAAQKPEKIEKKWLAEDIEALKLIPKLLPPETQTPEALIQIFGKESSYNEKVEFGAVNFGNGAALGYTSFGVSVYTFNNSLLSYEISTSASPQSWRLIRPYLTEAWKQNTQLPFQESESGIFYKFTNEDVLREYKNSISRELGEMKPVEIPKELKEAYEYLTAPFNEIQVSNYGCGYAATKVKGRKAIELFINAGRVDLIENILKGFNQGGRVYAAIALLEMKRKGAALKPETELTIEKVANLDISVSLCTGCFSYSKTAKEILKGYQLL